MRIPGLYHLVIEDMLHYVHKFHLIFFFLSLNFEKTRYLCDTGETTFTWETGRVKLILEDSRKNQGVLYFVT